jgi:outer membrane protein TolC
MNTLIRMVNARRTAAALAIPATLIVASASCGRFQRYEAAPVREPSANGFVHRTLDDPALREFLAAQGARAPDGGWTPKELALAALYFHPALREQAAAVAIARAEEMTAGTPPDIAGSAEVSRAARADEGKSTPWSVSLTSGLTFETGGKRAARRARARAFTLASVLRLEAVAWQLGAITTAEAGVRAAGADQEMDDARREGAALAELATLVRARYAEGQVTLADVAQAETESQRAIVAAVQAERARTAARLDLARALAVPLRAVDSLPLRADAAQPCARSAFAGFDSLGSVALHERYDIGVALADYAVAEGSLRIEIARQYPDITIGPGIAWDQGVFRWILSLGTPGFLRNRNRGPIGEARARRAATAARVITVQDSILAAVDSAVAVCGDASRETDATSALVRSAGKSLEIAQAAYERGETGQTEVAFARLAVLRATRAHHLAEQRAREAGAALESVLGAWPPGDPRWPDLTSQTSLFTKDETQ